MADMSAYEDRPSSKFKKRWLPLDFVEGTLPQPGDILTNPYYPQHWLEEKCWQIVDLCARLHIFGPIVITCRDPLTLERSFDNRSLTFEERMLAIVDLALHCKNRVGEMVNGSVIEEYVLAPGHLLGQTKMNNRNNEKRQVYIKTGRKQSTDAAASTTQVTVQDGVQDQALDEDQSRALIDFQESIGVNAASQAAADARPWAELTQADRDYYSKLFQDDDDARSDLSEMAPSDLLNLAAEVSPKAKRKHEEDNTDAAGKGEDEDDKRKRVRKA